MTAKRLGLTLIIIGFVGGMFAYLSTMLYPEASFLKLGVTSNLIQLVGIIPLLNIK